MVDHERGPAVGEDAELVEHLAAALWHTSTYKSGTRWEHVQEGIGTKENYRRMAADLLDALGLEQVGWVWGGMLPIVGPHGNTTMWASPTASDNDVAVFRLAPPRGRNAEPDGG